MRFKFSSLFRLSSVAFVASVFFFELSVNAFGSPLFAYSLAAVSAALLAGGLVDLRIHGHGGFVYDWSDAGKVCLSVLAGIVLTFVSAPYSPLGAFENSYAGFPLPFVSTFYGIFGSSSTGNLPAFLIDWLFWVALVYPVIWFVDSVLNGKLRGVGPLEGIGVSAFLTFGAFPGWAALGTTDVFGSVPVAVLPALALAFFLAPSAVIGALAALRKARGVGYAIVGGGVLFVCFLFGLVILAA